MFRRLLFPDSPSTAVARYGFAATVSLLTFLLRLLMEPILLEHSPTVFFTLAVGASAIRGGFGPGIFATALGSAAAIYFFPPVGSFARIEPAYLATGLLQLAAFVFVGLMLSWLGSELRALRWQALETARQRNQILESITDGFVALDQSGHFVFLNPAAERLMRKSRQELVGRTVWDAFPHPQYAEVLRNFKAVQQTGAAAHFEHYFDHDNRWFEFHVHPVGGGGITVYFRNITDRKESELLLRRTLSERDAALEEVRLLTGFLPICAACKRIRNESNRWEQMEAYISRHSEAQFSHTMCPECYREYYGELGAPENTT